MGANMIGNSAQGRWTDTVAFPMRCEEETDSEVWTTVRQRD